jgi:hypothetical protein
MTNKDRNSPIFDPRDSRRDKAIDAFRKTNAEMQDLGFSCPIAFQKLERRLDAEDMFLFRPFRRKG